MNKSFFLILGMHRSGTSCLTGALERCNVYLGDVKRNGKYNKKGYFEMVELQKIHEQILGLNKSSWYQPPLQTINIHDYHRQKLQAIVQQLRSKTPCGLKDPRTLLLLNCWKELIGQNHQLIGTFRHPMAVAQSLYIRNKLPIEQGIQLWIAYNNILVEEHQKKPFPLIYFDLSNVKKYRQNIIKLAKQFGLKPNYLSLYFFITSNLEHNRGKNFSMPTSCQKLYAYLMSNKY